LASNTKCICVLLKNYYRPKKFTNNTKKKLEINIIILWNMPVIPSWKKSPNCLGKARKGFENKNLKNMKNSDKIIFQAKRKVLKKISKKHTPLYIFLYLFS
jgi:hypothetical protein